jgi:hypothetical protein
LLGYRKTLALSGTPPNKAREIAGIVRRTRVIEKKSARLFLVRLPNLYFMKTKLAIQLIAVVIVLCLQQTLHAQSWSTTGNGGTNPNVNFVGTTNSKGLAFRTNNVERMRFKTNGDLGIGTVNPASKLNVDNGDFVSLSSPGYLVLGNVAVLTLAWIIMLFSRVLMAPAARFI